MSFIPKKLTTATKGIIKNNPLLHIALNASLHHNDAKADAVLAWGQKPSSLKAKKFATENNLSLITIEDGFLRSLSAGIDTVGASFIADDLGVYFDLTAPSRLQHLIFECMSHWDDHKQNYAHSLIDKIITHRLSKYNESQDAPNLTKIAGNDRMHVLIIDQVAGDASIQGAGASKDSFLAMLAHARSQYLDANIWIKAHPAGKGYFSQNDIEHPFYLTEKCNPIALLEQVSAVYTVSSHMGFEALLLNKKVYCFGVNWYSGFGLTDDGFIKDGHIYKTVTNHHQVLKNHYNAHDKPSIHQLFYASYINYSHYANPAKYKACGIDEVVEYLILNRAWQSRLLGDLMAYEFSRWKVPFVQGFLGFDAVNLIIKPRTRWRLFLTDGMNAKRVQRDDQKALSPLPDTTSYVTWGLKSKKSLADKLQKIGKQAPRIWCMEDGFIRSNGLGASLIAPLSVVMDDVGIYYDANHPSRLEQILTNIHLTDEQALRAKNLQHLMLTKRVSKYNVQTKNHEFVQKLSHLKIIKPNKTVRLVVGQVEDDASVKSCASAIKKNSDLLARVRTDFPDDIIVYKPHPDVEAGLRVGRANNHNLADLVASDVAMPDCLDGCDVVHTISSLTGFEALLRGLEVVCYGVPFYAGFGLTTDVVEPDNTVKINALNRRCRADGLTLPALIYGVIVEYPLYHLPHGHGLAQPEAVIEYLYNHQHIQISPTFTQRAKTAFMRLRKILKE
ncbi:capsular polysaccharide biosynthesis protein [Moraxella sp.]|uniref:capsular polysaccharide biosynthesis protein n=1 Tax=Moraxella sp. TaxID=479 RepID=UPI00262C848E|nr:capsular polysaccharide biosynthesis protein [Moraxella sp.]MCP3897107.1 capsular polysaccharide biosynthesis protein [Moraxella sp.]